jgi:hypothetical protein
MIGKIPTCPARVLTAALAIGGLLAIGSGAASAMTPTLVYSNLNTVPANVNGFPNEDTFSLDSENFPIGGMVEFSPRPGTLKNLTTQVDSFTCEHGLYSLENCLTLHPTKKFQYQMTASVYEVGPHNEALGSPIATSTATLKLPFRPTTNTSCPPTAEGKGFGPNCDVGGVLATVTFKKFTPKAVLPEKAIILLDNTPQDSASDIVNVGLQASYKEFKNGEFIEEPALEGGVPWVGSDPLPEAIFTKGLLNTEGDWQGYQPVFSVFAVN